MRRHLLGILVEQGWGFATKFDSSAWVLRNTGVKDVKVCRVCDGLSMFELGKPRKTYENLP